MTWHWHVKNIFFNILMLKQCFIEDDMYTLVLVSFSFSPFFLSTFSLFLSCSFQAQNLVGCCSDFDHSMKILSVSVSFLNSFNSRFSLLTLCYKSFFFLIFLNFFISLFLICLSTLLSLSQNWKYFFNNFFF